MGKAAETARRSMSLGRAIGVQVAHSVRSSPRSVRTIAFRSKVVPASPCLEKVGDQGTFPIVMRSPQKTRKMAPLPMAEACEPSMLQKPRITLAPHDSQEHAVLAPPFV